MEMDRSCGTDLGTKWEKEARAAEGDMDENSRKRTRWDEIMGHSLCTALAKNRDKWRQLTSGPAALGEKELNKTSTFKTTACMQFLVAGSRDVIVLYC